MMIVLILAALAALVLIACVGVAVVTLVIGVGTVSFKQTRVVAPIFLLIIPLAALGALAGCFGLGAYLVKLNDNLLFWGPVLGLFVGGCAGGLLGVAVSSIIWWRAFRRRNATAAAPAAPAARAQ